MARGMKNSGIEWIGEIPDSWGFARIGSLYTLRNTKVSDTDYPPLSVTNKGIVPQLETAAKTNAHDDRKLVKQGDFAINSRSDRRGSCGISRYNGSVSLINTILAPNSEMNPQYYDWLFHTVQFADEFYKWGHGIVDDLWTTGWQDMKRIVIPLPSIEEQEMIASFLDVECAEFDTLMADIQAQIETLEQYKRSVITEAVTKGLNPNIPLKDGGTDWIGQIPIHWRISKIKYEIMPIERSVYETDGIVTCFRNGEVTLRSNRREEGFTISLTEHGYHGVDVGDLVIHGMDAFAGAIGCSDSRGKITPVVHVCRTTGNNRFFMYFLRTMAYGDILMDLSDGVRIRSSDYRNFSKLGKLSICVPPLDEQDKIVDYLDSKVKQIDDVITQKQEQLEILEEYKKSVVFEYVTGKKEVPISCPQSAMKQ